MFPAIFPGNYGCSRSSQQEQSRELARPQALTAFSLYYLLVKGVALDFLVVGSFFCPHKVSNDLISAANQLTTLVEGFTDSLNIPNDAGCSAGAENVVLTGQQKTTVVFNAATL